MMRVHRGGYPFPRRNCLDLQTPVEVAIRSAIVAVEAAGADVRLTNAVVLLQQAYDEVADLIDERLGA
jgi:hypothetical protein